MQHLLLVLAGAATKKEYEYAKTETKGIYLYKTYRCSLMTKYIC